MGLDVDTELRGAECAALVCLLLFCRWQLGSVDWCLFAVIWLCDVALETLLDILCSTVVD